MFRHYRVILEWNEEEGGYTVTVPALPGCVSQGESKEEASKRIKEAIRGYIKVLKEDGQPVPDDTDVELLTVEVAA